MECVQGGSAVVHYRVCAMGGSCRELMNVSKGRKKNREEGGDRSEEGEKWEEAEAAFLRGRQKKKKVGLQAGRKVCLP